MGGPNPEANQGGEQQNILNEQMGGPNPEANQEGRPYINQKNQIKLDKNPIKGLKENNPKQSIPEGFTPTPLFRKLKEVYPNLYHKTVKCPQCSGTGIARSNIGCSACYSLGRVFLNQNHTSMVDYQTQRKIVDNLYDKLLNKINEEKEQINPETNKLPQENPPKPSR